MTKSDLGAAVEFDEALARRDIQAVRPGKEILKLSAKTGEGMSDFLQFLEGRRPSSQAPLPPHNTLTESSTAAGSR
jgi:hydrogenase nickel incorporation protein HypB